MFDTARLLEAKGHKVSFLSMHHPQNLPSPYSRYFVSQVDYDQPGNILWQFETAARVLYSREAKRRMEELVEAEEPDIVHLHNIHHQISPSILHSLKKRRIPVVMTLHDYKMVCPAYELFVHNGVCEKCRGGRYYWCLFRRCLKGSVPKSALAVLEMYLHHRALRIYNLVDIFAAPSVFLSNKLQAMGFKGRIIHLPNFMDATKVSPSFGWKETTFVYFGRLSGVKGLFTLLDAARGLDAGFKIIGDGPAAEDLRRKAEDEGLGNVHFLGYRSGKELQEEIRDAMAVVLPSEWYENNPRSVIEAFALGKPVIGARIGGIPELVRDGETGLTFEPGNAQDLQVKIQYLITHPDTVREMGVKARRFVEEKLAPGIHYQGLMKVYRMAAQHSR